MTKKTGHVVENWSTYWPVTPWAVCRTVHAVGPAGKSLIGKELVATFVEERDARAYVTNVLEGDHLRPRRVSE